MLRIPTSVTMNSHDMCKNVYDMVLLHGLRTGHACKISDLERLACLFHGNEVPIRTILALNVHVFDVDCDFVRVRVVT
jgi:hypothetical protein